MRPAAVAGAVTVCPSCVVSPYVCSAITHGHPPDGPAHLPCWEDTFPPASVPIITRCLRRVSFWRLPPNWSVCDWLEEVKEVLGVAAMEAEADFDSARGVPFGAFLFHRGLARVLTRYRQEWNYGTRFSSECARRCAWGDEEPNPLEGRSPGISRTACEVPCAPEPDLPLEELAEALASVSESNRELIELLFWQGRTESEAARELGISQPAISKRLHAVLAALRRRMAPQK